MMDTATIVFVTGIISCVIGVASFVTGIASRARNDGKLESKLEFCLQGIEDIKKSVGKIENKQSSHDNAITRLEAEVKNLSKTHETEIERVEHEIETLRERVNGYERQ